MIEINLFQKGRLGTYQINKIGQIFIEIFLLKIITVKILLKILILYFSSFVIF
jgi:hypothetical protein